MFNLGVPELVIVFGLGLVVLGPRRLPEVARYMGRFYGMIRRTAFELRHTLNAEIIEEERRERRERAEARREELREKRKARKREVLEEARRREDRPGPTLAPEEASAEPDAPSKPEAGAAQGEGETPPAGGASEAASRPEPEDAAAEPSPEVPAAEASSSDDLQDGP